MLNDLTDVDDFLSKADFLSMIRMRLKWPWTETHFIRSDHCFGCGYLIVHATIRPKHFMITAENIEKLIYYDLFWCPICD